MENEGGSKQLGGSSAVGEDHDESEDDHEDHGDDCPTECSRSQQGDALVGLKQLEAHGALFKDLVKRIKVNTGKLVDEASTVRDPELNVVNIIITYDSKHCVALTADVRQELT